MGRSSIITNIGEWLIDQALDEPEIVHLFEQVCSRLRAAGVPLGRARLTWPTLHPLFEAETILWKREVETEFEQFRHQDEASADWKASPMAFMLDHQIDQLRRNLDGQNKLMDFPILDDLLNQGYTDYLVIASGFRGANSLNENRIMGIIVTWASDRPGGFSDDDIADLNKIQRRFAAAVKSAVQRRIASNITETYLGVHAGQEVLNGAIRLGDGRETQAVVWFADMRNSTSLAETMAPADFLELLNDYFECSAGPAIKHGGEVLDFIGDAVLAIFPYDDEEGKTQAVACATMALEETMQLAGKVNQRRQDEGKVPFRFGVSLNSGTLMFGNIGVPSRLSFSVIGPTINEAERIENLTKAIDANALATPEIAEANPDRWISIGAHRLDGVLHDCELYALKQEVDLASPISAEQTTSAEVRKS